MKFKTTRKSITQHYSNIVYAGYCDLQFLLHNNEPIAYTSGVYGWNFDVYDVYGVIICTGYRGMPGRRANNIAEYNKKAREILSRDNPEPYAKQCEQLKNLLKEFCEQA